MKLINQKDRYERTDIEVIKFMENDVLLTSDEPIPEDDEIIRT